MRGFAALSLLMTKNAGSRASRQDIHAGPGKGAAANAVNFVYFSFPFFFGLCCVGQRMHILRLWTGGDRAGISIYRGIDEAPIDIPQPGSRIQAASASVSPAIHHHAMIANSRRSL